VAADAGDPAAVEGELEAADRLAEVADADALLHPGILAPIGDTITDNIV
jgi:hypothetical protein